MKPTAKLRFVERTVELNPFCMTVSSDGKTTRGAHTYRILQQWWEQTGMTMNLGWGGEMPIGEIKGEWRDVPLEEEK